MQTARNWIGISRDELRRIRAQHRPWLELWYPLIFEVPHTRQQCVQRIRDTGWSGDIPHSACWICPNKGDREWIEMRRTDPQDFEACLIAEAKIRETDPHFYLHESCKPLSEVRFDQQQSMFPENGCTEGCYT